MDRLRELREDMDLYQKHIAEILGIDNTTYSNIECKKHEISTFYLIKLSRYYNTSIDYILYRTDDREPYEFCYKEFINIKNRLKELRKFIGKTQRELAFDLGIPLKTYIKYENTTLSLNIELLHKFADYYKTSIDYIVYNTDDIKPHKRSIVDWKEK